MSDPVTILHRLTAECATSHSPLLMDAIAEITRLQADLNQMQYTTGELRAHIRVIADKADAALGFLGVWKSE